MRKRTAIMRKTMKRDIRACFDGAGNGDVEQRRAAPLDRSPG
jgi:hypothetical protein